MWRIHVPALSRTTVATDLAEVEFVASDLIALTTEQPFEDFEIVVNVE